MSYTKQNFFKGQTLTAEALNVMDAQIAENATQVEKKVNLPVDKNGNVLNGRAGQVLISKGDGTTEWLEPEEEAPEGSLPFEKQAKLVQAKPIAGTKLKCTSIIPPSTTGVNTINLTRCGKNLANVADKKVFNGSVSTMPSVTIPVDGVREITASATLHLYNYAYNIRCVTSSGKGLQGSVVNAEHLAETEVEGVTYLTLKTSEADTSVSYYWLRAWYNPNPSGTRSNNCGWSNYQVELGSMSAYEQYNGDTYTVDFGRAVYGGKYSWHTGELIITHELVDGVVVEKETPETVYLEEKTIYAVATDSGINTVWSDCGQTLVSGYVSGGSVGEITNSETVVTMKYREKRLLALGDSITHAGKYLTALQKYVPFAAMDNQGIGGHTMFKHATYGGCCTIIDNFEDNVKNADVVSIAYGTNDSQYFVSGAYQIGELAAAGSTFDRSTFYGAYQYTIEKILTWKPTVKIIPVVPAYAMTTDNQTAKDNMAQAIRNVANFYGLEYVDLYFKSGMNSFNVNDYTWDGLHHNDAFGDIFAKKFIPILLY